MKVEREGREREDGTATLTPSVDTDQRTYRAGSAAIDDSRRFCTAKSTPVVTRSNSQDLIRAAAQLPLPNVIDQAAVSGEVISVQQ